MPLTESHIDQLRTLIESRFPNWEGVKDPRFQKGEIQYKRATVAKAKEMISRPELSRLISAGEFNEILDRLLELGRDNNLLWRQVPTAGDLNILHREDLDKAGFCRAVMDLLYGDGNSPARLGRYLRYVRSQELPDKWTFPTYFLFICHPENDLFIKPSTTKRFLALIDRPGLYSTQPSDEIYAELLEIGNDLLEAFRADGAQDMVDAQSLIWVTANAGATLNLHKKGIQHEDQLLRLLNECAKTYPTRPEGQEHFEMYPAARKAAVRNYEDILRARERGEDVTDLVLLKLLPYANNESNRAEGAWIHVASAIQGDVKRWFENAGWTDEGDWPAVADRILTLVERAIEEPENLVDHCASFSRSKFSTGFQTGMLSPILSALDPEQYILINSKSRAAINYFLGTDFSAKLNDYPDLNVAGHFLVQRLGAELDAIAEHGIRRDEAFDMFSHWLVAEKGFSFGQSRYWKVSPGRGARHWESCLEGQYIGVGWDELGDLAGRSKDDFDEALKALAEEKEGWTVDGGNQVWTFAKEIQEGDIVVANEGTKRVLGIGRVSGPYYFVEDEPFGHRLPVDWFDTTTREVNELGWRSTLIELDEEKVKAIQERGPDKGQEHRPAFSEQTFALLSRLSENPTKDFYDAHKDDFKKHVEEPFKGLMKEVAGLLPPEMREVLETESYVFSRIPKNDYGRGGAWDFFWGAFYPSGEKRISSAQLFASINRNVLHYGFYIGEYGSDQRKRFLRNAREHKVALKSVLPQHLQGHKLNLGGQEDHERFIEPDSGADSVEEWLEKLEEEEIRVSKTIEKKELLATDRKHLREEVLSTFRAVFPLVLLANSDEPMKAIADLTLEEEPETEVHPKYGLDQLSEDTGFDRDLLEKWKSSLQRKGQAILYGPPGTGKTYLAERLAKHLIGGGDGIMELVQFHPSYAYEEFIQGIRPETEGGSLAYRMVQGRFVQFCRKARGRSGTSVLIIDEINRANLSRVFGELMYLLEYRNEQVQLAGGGQFRIPEQVLIIGTMNTADRSIALVDHALRRRFSFIKLQPQYEVLRSYHEDRGLNVGPLIQKLTEINTEIGDPNFHLGITFFLVDQLADTLPEIWEMEIEPYLEELFFDDPGKVDGFRWGKIAEDVSPDQ